MDRGDHRPKPGLVNGSRVAVTLLVIGLACLAPVLLYRLQDATLDRTDSQRKVRSRREIGRGRWPGCLHVPVFRFLLGGMVFVPEA